MMDDVAKVSIVLASTCKQYGREYDDSMDALYLDLLAVHSVESIVWAFKQHMMTPDKCRFFPMPGDLINHITAARENEKFKHLKGGSFLNETGPLPGVDRSWRELVYAEDREKEKQI